MNVVLADYGAGNVRSVAAAFARAGADVTVSTAADEVLEAPLAVIAGVGNVAAAAAGLEPVSDALRERVVRARPTLGICVGLQLLFEESEEGGRVVKGVRFERLRDVGDPIELAQRYSELGADELVFLDITASLESRGPTVALVERAAERLEIPFTVGGGISSRADAQALLRAGADKVAVNRAAVDDPELLTALADEYGSQAVVCAIDARGGEVVTHAGSRPRGLRTTEWAIEATRRGAGEILLTSIDADGTRSGYDLELTAAVAAAVEVPVIASGGAGDTHHLADAFAAVSSRS